MSRDQFHAQFCRHLMLVRIIQRTSHTDLNGVCRIDQTFFQRTTERRSVVILLSKYLIAKIRVRIEVNQCYFAVFLGNSTQLCQCDRMVTA